MLKLAPIPLENDDNLLDSVIHALIDKKLIILNQRQIDYLLYKFKSTTLVNIVESVIRHPHGKILTITHQADLVDYKSWKRSTMTYNRMFRIDLYLEGAIYTLEL